MAIYWSPVMFIYHCQCFAITGSVVSWGLGLPWNTKILVSLLNVVPESGFEYFLLRKLNPPFKHSHLQLFTHSVWKKRRCVTGITSETKSWSPRYLAVKKLISCFTTVSHMCLYCVVSHHMTLEFTPVQFDFHKYLKSRMVQKCRNGNCQSQSMLLTMTTSRSKYSIGPTWCCVLNNCSLYHQLFLGPANPQSCNECLIMWSGTGLWDSVYTCNRTGRVKCLHNMLYNRST